MSSSLNTCLAKDRLTIFISHTPPTLHSLSQLDWHHLYWGWANPSVKGYPLVSLISSTTVSLLDKEKCLAQHVEVLIILEELHNFLWNMKRFRFFLMCQASSPKRHVQLIFLLLTFELYCKLKDNYSCKELDKKIKLLGS